jgi:Zn-finger nucleic acid-binding protein
MRCPACKRSLKKIKVGSATLDICQGGCGGIWFDGDELDKVAKSTAAGKKVVAEITRTVEVAADEHRVLKCGHCRGVDLEQKLFSLGSGVIMDRCPKCAGIWLDHGELETIHEETIPAPRPVRHVVKRKGQKPVGVPINFQLVREVQKLRISVA